MKTDLLPFRLTSVYSAEAMVASGVRPWHLMCCRSSASLHSTSINPPNLPQSPHPAKAETTQPRSLHRDRLDPHGYSRSGHCHQHSCSGAFATCPMLCAAAKLGELSRHGMGRERQLMKVGGILGDLCGGQEPAVLSQHCHGCRLEDAAPSLQHVHTLAQRSLGIPRVLLQSQRACPPSDGGT